MLSTIESHLRRPRAVVRILGHNITPNSYAWPISISQDPTRPAFETPPTSCNGKCGECRYPIVHVCPQKRHEGGIVFLKTYLGD